MVNRKLLFKKIPEIYPQIGDCDHHMTVGWDDENQAWAVDFQLKGEPIRHYLEDADAAACLLGRQCVGMGIEFGQFM